MSKATDWPEPRSLLWRLLAQVDWLTGAARLFGSRFDAVVLYHSIGGVDGTNYKWDLPVTHFRQQIQTLASRFEIVSLAELATEPHQSQKRIAITFDDAFRNVYRHGIPVLRELDLPATVFVTPEFVDDNNAEMLRQRHSMDSSARNIVMTANQIQDLADDELFTIGNHTATHNDLTELDAEADLRKEIVGGKETLEQRFGVTVEQFSYPYGVINDAAAEIVAETHEVATTSVPSLLDASTDRYRIPRLDACQPAAVLCFETTDIAGWLRRAARSLGDR